MSNIATARLDACIPEKPLPRNEAAQLSRLSSVLNGLEGGACRMRRHVEEAMEAVRSGRYTVDALQLSKRIVGEALGTA